VALPGGSADGVFMDYIAYDAKTDRVWVPAGNSAAVDVFDAADPQADPDHRVRRRKRWSGTATSAWSARARCRWGPGVEYVGNRGDSTVCAFDATTLAKGACGTLDSMPDGVAYVAATSEVWVTTPRDQSIRILDATTLAQRRACRSMAARGLAVDAKRGRFYTNLEDKDQTLAIDLKTHATVATWPTTCGEEGGHGISLDPDAGFCSWRAAALRGDGRRPRRKILSSIDTGDGVDNLDYLAATQDPVRGVEPAAGPDRGQGRARRRADLDRGGSHRHGRPQRCGRRQGRGLHPGRPGVGGVDRVAKP